MDILKITKENRSQYENTDLVHNGHVEIDIDLKIVSFISMSVTGYILAKAGSSIKAGEDIKAGWGIEAGEDIKAGSGIKAGWGIKAGLSITCKTVIKCTLRIFAGLCIWKIPTDEEKTISCKRIESGTVEYGIVKLISDTEKTKE